MEAGVGFMVALLVALLIVVGIMYFSLHNGGDC